MALQLDFCCNSTTIDSLMHGLMDQKDVFSLHWCWLNPVTSTSQYVGYFRVRKSLSAQLSGDLFSTIELGEKNRIEAPARPTCHHSMSHIWSLSVSHYQMLKSTLNETPVASEGEMNMETSNGEHPQEITMNLITKQGHHHRVLAITQPSVLSVAGIWIVVSPTSG